MLTSVRLHLRDDYIRWTPPSLGSGSEYRTRAVRRLYVVKVTLSEGIQVEHYVQHFEGSVGGG